MYGGRSCWHMGKRLPINMAGPLPEGGVLQPEGQRIIWKPKTFIVYCAQEGCDYNFFHSMGLAYYSTYVALQKLGLESLEGIHVEFYECLSGKPNEIKSPELIATARERHTVFMEAFRPASINFVDIELQNTSQHLGCYESVYFVGNEGWPWHCRTTDTSEDPMLAGFVNLVTEALGFGSKPPLPEKDRVLYFKRENTVRTLLNTKEVEAAFPVPYSIYAPGSSTRTYRERLREIIGMTRNASIIFGMHGAGLTNAIFAAPDAVVIEVTNCYWRIPLYRNLAVLTGKNYLESVVALDEGCKTLGENPEFMEHHGEHLTIPLNDFASVFDQARIILQRARSRQRHTARTL
ncbi:hypothetical protein KFL_004080050 [Klebsormidium nitens]|uniref:Glycosyltransferase 61 catalytic domain-containing protein n=1 Tax=Klebsormidium nitens TaxID=105231 RepID=A0A1Y1IHI3_KLENI|nr:hypothetical protein KFL_004080050 [Klebsormidium nitens]|eukprot:GAQ88196.1 hypothetical protein KFL_004080050 [Klebsormidium nitens]